jgi:hypothetical protein
LESREPRSTISHCQAGLAVFFIGSGLLMLLSWPFPAFEYSGAELIWTAVVVLVDVVAALVSSHRVHRLQ